MMFILFIFLIIKSILFSIHMSVRQMNFSQVDVIFAAAPLNPAFYYTFDTVLGSVVTNNGTMPSLGGSLVGSTVVASGVLGNCVQITSSNGYVQVGSAGMSLAGDWTLAAWVRSLKATSTYRTLFRGLPVLGHHPVIVPLSLSVLGSWKNTASGDGGSLALHFYSSTGCDISGLSADWHHIAAVGSGGSTVFYLDGTACGTANFQSQTDVYAVGNYQGGGQVFADYLDEVYGYSRALSAADVLSLYNSALTYCSGLTANTTVFGLTRKLGGQTGGDLVAVRYNGTACLEEHRDSKP